MPKTKTPEPEVTELILNPYGDPYPEEVQRLANCVLPDYGVSVQTLVQKAITAGIRQHQNRPREYGCLHCRDGEDLPLGYVCKRCGADNPR